ncbi:MAG: energy-coupling factor transporter transmembrane component T [Conexivisphaerales archaeon]
MAVSIMLTAEALGWLIFIVGAAVPVYIIFGLVKLSGFREITRFERHKSFYYRLSAGSKLVALVSIALSAPLENWWLGLLVPSVVMMSYLTLRNGIRKFLIGVSLTIAFIWATSWGGISDLLPYLIQGRTLRGLSSSTIIYQFATRSFLLNYRVAGVFLMALILIMTSTPTEVLHVLRKARIPNGVSFSLIVGIKTVPIIFDSLNSIIKVQFMRGWGSVGRRSLYPIYAVVAAILAIIPTMIFLLRGARNIAISTGTRAFGAYRNRTYLNPLSFHVADYLVIGVALCLLALIIVSSLFML